MNIFENMRVKASICEVANRFDEDPGQVRKCIEEAIAAAWETEDSDTRELQKRLFPGGKPSVEEFIAVIGGMVHDPRKK